MDEQSALDVDVDEQAALDMDNNNPQAAWQAVDGGVNMHRNPLVAWRVKRAGHDLAEAGPYEAGSDTGAGARPDGAMATVGKEVGGSAAGDGVEATGGGAGGG